MRAAVAPILLALVVFFSFFAELILPDLGFGNPRNFNFRDSGHFYYPYFKLIAQEWGEGRIPLWNPYEDGGTPLAANPTASAFYPLKLMFCLPFGLAYRWFHMLHVFIAWGCCYSAARGFGISRWGASLAGLAYAFGGIVFFQIYNIVFLVGAAWLPLGILAVDRLVQRPTLGWSMILATVLGLQVLGGDPEIAYVLGAASVPYALYQNFGFRRGSLFVSALLFAGYGIVQGGRYWPTLQLLLEGGSIPRAEQASTIYLASIPLLFLAGMGVLIFFRRRLLSSDGFRRSTKLLGLAAVIAFFLSAVQVVPTMDLTRRTDRAAPEAPHEPIAFSFYPLRMLEFIFPTIFGRAYPIHSRWPEFDWFETGTWVPTVYMGLVPLVLGLWTLARPGRASNRWLAVLCLVMLLTSLGKFGGPKWLFSPPTPKHFNVVLDTTRRTLYGESDGLYLLFESTIPGFRSFRYPSKMLVIVAAALSLLAGAGVDRLSSTKMNKGRWFFLGGLFLLSAAGLLEIFRANVIDWIKPAQPSQDMFGPLDTAAAFINVRNSILQAGMVAVLFGALVWMGVRGWISLAMGLNLLLALDLFMACRWMVITDLQSEIDSRPKVLTAIENEEVKSGDGQPFRIHRTRIYNPLPWHQKGSENRLQEISRWEKDTLQPKYAEPYGLPYVTVTGTMSIYDSQFFFAPWVVNTPDPIKRAVTKAPEKMAYFPRVGFNLWNAKYFVLPRLIRLDNEERGVWTLLANADGSACPTVAESSAHENDYLVLKNNECFPRAWIVHQADCRKPIKGLRRRDRLLPMEQLLFRNRDGGIRLWVGEEHGEYPLTSMVMLEVDHLSEVEPFASNQPVTAAEVAKVERYRSDEVEISANLETPGFLVVSETFYPGWSATVDGEPATIFRANRAMRAIGLPAGRHHVVMRYRDRLFEASALVSLAAWAILSVWSLVHCKRFFAAKDRNFTATPQ